MTKTGDAIDGEASAEMTPIERVRAVLAGKRPDRTPVALWRHFPERDQTAADLTAAALDWQRRFGFDLIKFMPPGDYPTIDWGAESRYQGGSSGTRTTVRFPITTSDDWGRLPPLDVRRGFNGEMLDAVRLTRQSLDPNVPLLQTVFSPLTIAAKLSAGRVVADLAEHPDRVHAGLRRIATITREVLAASLAAGADGIFFASQLADAAVISREAYLEFGVPYDLFALDALDPAAIVLLHLHGERPMLDLADRYPPAILNWHDRRVGPPLADEQRRSGRPVAGGIDERAIAERTPEEVAAEARDAAAATGGADVIVTPGCVIPTTTPEGTIAAAVAAVAAREGPGRR